MKNKQTVIPVDGSNKKTKRKPFKLSRKVFSYPYICSVAVNNDTLKRFFGKRRIFIAKF